MARFFQMNEGSFPSTSKLPILSLPYLKQGNISSRTYFNLNTKPNHSLPTSLVFDGSRKYNGLLNNTWRDPFGTSNILYCPAH